MDLAHSYNPQPHREHIKKGKLYNLTFSWPDNAAIFVNVWYDWGLAESEDVSSSCRTTSRLFILESAGSSARRRSNARRSSSSLARASDNVFSAWQTHPRKTMYSFMDGIGVLLHAAY